MTITELLAYGGGGVALLLTVVQIIPIKVNPWSAIARWLGKALNADVLKELQGVKQSQAQTNARLDAQVKVEDQRNADNQRGKILRFNVEVVRKLPHTWEDFIEILNVIDEYERYCKSHPEYSNNRAVQAVENIKRVYAERLKENDFYKAGGA